MGIERGTRAAVHTMLVLGTMLLAQLLVVATPAHAQGVPPPPMPSSVDERGVDLISGSLIAGAMDLSIGPDDHRGLRFARQWSKNGWRIADLPTISGSTTYPIVSYGGQSIPFKPASGGGYEPYFQNGATLNAARTLFTGPDGTQITFTSSHGNLTMASNLGQGSQIVFPDGVRWTYHYQTGSFYVGPELPYECEGPNPHPNCWPLLAQWQTHHVQRLTSITSSTGYQIKLSYATNSFAYGNESAWWYIAQATAINNAIEYCAPTAAVCTLSGTWPQVTYGNWVDGKIDTVTDLMGRTTNYNYNVSGNYPTQLAGIRPPGASTNAITYAYNPNSKVSSVAVAGAGTYGYSYGAGSTTVTDPSASTTVVNYYTTGPEAGLVSSVKNRDNKTTHYAYCPTGQPTTCPEGLLRTVTASEQNTVTYGYDARGNVMSTTYGRKPGSTTTPATISTSATYWTCTAGTQAYCNKPQTTTDARGQVTNYTYDPTSGQLARVTLPADSAGVRPETRIAYGDIYARYRNSAGTLVQAPTPVRVPVSVSSCRTAAVGNPASCVGSAEERVTQVAYPTGAAASNAQPVSVTSKAGNNTLVATTTLGYDNYGRVITVDGPLAGAGDTVRYRYNLAGQLVGEVAAETVFTPNSRLATRYLYNSRGQLYLTQSGTVANQTDAAWANFAVTTQSTTQFDTHGRPVRQLAQQANGTAHQVVDMVMMPGAGCNARWCG